jgi:hypothetical protein
VEESQLLADAGFVCAQRVDPPPNGRDMLAQVQIQGLCQNSHRNGKAEYVNDSA